MEEYVEGRSTDTEYLNFCWLSTLSFHTSFTPVLSVAGYCHLQEGMFFSCPLLRSLIFKVWVADGQVWPRMCRSKSIHNQTWGPRSGFCLPSPYMVVQRVGDCSFWHAACRCYCSYHDSRWDARKGFRELCWSKFREGEESGGGSPLSVLPRKPLASS